MIIHIKNSKKYYNISGPIKHISVNPADNSKILIGFDTGLICLWDLSSKKGEYLMYHFHENICIS